MLTGWFVVVGVGCVAGFVAWLIGVAMLRALRAARKKEADVAERRVHIQRSFSALFVIASMYYTLPFTGLPKAHLKPVRHVLLILLILTLGWFLLKVGRAIEDALVERYPVSRLPDDPRARRARTQIAVLRRVFATLVVLVAIGAALTTIEPIRVLGTSVLASAGVASVVLGIAAQGTLSHVLAGLQLAFTDALRIDDVVVLEGEWGHIENVQLTYVVVRSWDERRIILPTTYFTTKPYQNWTKYESRVLGTIDVQLDYTADIDVLRAETQRLLDSSEHWDHQYWVLEMTEMTSSTVTIRIAASAPNGAKVWWLRVQLREGLVKYLRDNHPQWLPRGRGAYQP
ncbi:Small-conductance mechanosensitive channel [Micromonospora pattaloongensis]|uniref:Small-conductance mechanosensitive channel n=1 Tax=Micromonospora pattaloongensis TaxID=405436 RepID=A0A1H3JJP6_9ACTN|nr:mechanosensitive ion channel domain-containing protein [Micromonospora pattaloongensis]SDY39809.1 Small-conductance mechanosensitive channel [Micromonospora pattaloongensis]